MVSSVPSIPRATVQDAGLWRRLVALWIDVCIVGFFVSTVVLLLALAVPGVQSLITLDSGFAFFVQERTLETKTLEKDPSLPDKPAREESIVERTIWDRWTYRYRVTEYDPKPGEKSSKSWRDAHWQQIDPGTGEDIDTTDVSDLTWLVLLFYWIGFEASRLQASPGKWAVAIKVEAQDGSRLNLLQSAARNILKLLSATLLMIGFLMAAFTRRKQALHDLIARCYVVVS